MFIILTVEVMSSLDVNAGHHHIYLFIYFLSMPITENPLLKPFNKGTSSAPAELMAKLQFT